MAHRVNPLSVLGIGPLLFDIFFLLPRFKFDRYLTAKAHNFGPRLKRIILDRWCRRFFLAGECVRLGFELHQAMCAIEATS
ncbi:MAG TPA: hypothetical protein ENI07_21690 [Desulfobacterales bacterium]|nr:hypothetical protein [Desulfobacterales bacterium]